MISLYVCMGSACHLKLAQPIVEVFRKKLQEHQLEDKVTIKGSFCMGLCNEAVPVRVEDQIIHDVTVENAAAVFESRILPLLTGG